MQIRKKFVKEFLLELQKTKLDNIHSEETLSFVEEILRCFDDDNSTEHENNQGLNRIRYFFRGYVAKACSGTIFCDRKCNKLNKMSARLYVKHCYKC